MKISLITACYNSAKTIKTAMESVLAQKGVDIEYIIVDGGSKDGTVDIIKEFASRSVRPASPGCLVIKWISEPDRGMYDAINKGIKMATGDIVGILNADDVLASDDTLAHIASAFEQKESPVPHSPFPVPQRIDALYADIRFVKEGESVEALREAPTVRYCSAAKWRPWMFRFAAMVPHPSFYVRVASVSSGWAAIRSTTAFAPTSSWSCVIFCLQSSARHICRSALSSCAWVECPHPAGARTW